MIKPWLRFFRVVNLPTVPGDVWVGAVAVWFGAGIICDYAAPLFNATIAGVLLYMFGLADNDIVGAKTDEGRPIPEGRIPMWAAQVARGVCLLGAIVVAHVPDAFAGVPLPEGWRMCAFFLVMAIAIYNRRKWWWLMGVCRGLNVLCGGIAALTPLLPNLQLSAARTCLGWLGLVCLVWTVYIAAVTKYSEGEEMDAAKKRRVGFLIGAIVYLQIIALLLFQSGIVVLVGVLLVMMRLMKRFLPEVSAS